MRSEVKCSPTPHLGETCHLRNVYDRAGFIVVALGQNSLLSFSRFLVFLLSCNYTWTLASAKAYKSNTASLTRKFPPTSSEGVWKPLLPKGSVTQPAIKPSKRATAWPLTRAQTRPPLTEMDLAAFSAQTTRLARLLKNLSSTVATKKPQSCWTLENVTQHSKSSDHVRQGLTSGLVAPEFSCQE